MSESHGLRHIVAGLITAFALAVLAISVASAKGNFDMLTIQDPASGHEITVTEPGLMGFFAFSDFENGTRQAPVVVGPGHEVTRWANGGQGGRGSVAFDRLRWYDTSSANTRGHGWVFYEGIVNGSSEYDGLWFESTRNADAMMEDILSGRVQAASSAANQWAIAFGLAGIVAGVLIGGISARGFIRRRNHGMLEDQG